ncbi:LysR family transcriptional regulator [Marinomonas rhizomae]|uniref:DNA-binding transcriptional LysR family regulator n=1 Tax=Marinomonas rhizomae TaxID=491948 RepID=A0A366JF48_9GAMM|nr:LysR family transcriptional regulator [Marinomonas rhizomae]RBP85591.1 DNA-binding transcriptional LysR family regulator [Marinomonas rhizomae]RNF75779.1 LysR family transcriptional regulator [Marinomonas rhizomae]
MYDINDLYSFITLIETENLTKAAKQLEVSKSTLSRRISHLEACVGQALLLRQANKILPNAAGKAFYPHACKILDATKLAQKTIDTLQDSVVGELTITAYYGLARSWLPKEIIKFADNHPEISISLKTTSIFSELEQSDIGIWLGTLQPSKFKEEMLGHLTCGLYASKTFQQENTKLEDIDGLEDIPWVNFHHFYQPAGDLELRHAEDGRKRVQIPKSQIWTDQIAMQLEQIARGKGVGVLPDYMVAMREKHHPGDLVRVLPQWQLPLIPVYLLYPYGSLPKRMSEFLHHFRNSTLTILEKQ